MQSTGSGKKRVRVTKPVLEERLRAAERKLEEQRDMLEQACKDAEVARRERDATKRELERLAAERTRTELHGPPCRHERSMGILTTAYFDMPLQAEPNARIEPTGGRVYLSMGSVLTVVFPDVKAWAEWREKIIKIGVA